MPFLSLNNALCSKSGRAHSNQPPRSARAETKEARTLFLRRRAAGPRILPPRLFVFRPKNRSLSFSFAPQGFFLRASFVFRQRVKAAPALFECLGAHKIAAAGAAFRSLLFSRHGRRPRCIGPIYISDACQKNVAICLISDCRMPHNTHSPPNGARKFGIRQV